MGKACNWTSHGSRKQKPLITCVWHLRKRWPLPTCQFSKTDDTKCCQSGCREQPTCVPGGLCAASPSGSQGSPTGWNSVCLWARVLLCTLGCISRDVLLAQKEIHVAGGLASWYCVVAKSKRALWRNEQAKCAAKTRHDPEVMSEISLQAHGLGSIIVGEKSRKQN